jgi:A/G-specific adenine glycosylase
MRWYDSNKRDLPWRVDRDPYRVWVSEIMLQQTRVNAVVGYYHRFLKRFPDLDTLAAARVDSVLTAWSGLGYYRRARALHAAAKQIVSDYGGQFPKSSEELHRLPGIGRYTSAAISSIAFGEAVAVVDGNVERVLARLYGKRLAGEALWNAAQELLYPKRPGDFNQAMMELGATVCLPGEPMCDKCPVHGFCRARGRSEKPIREARRKRKIHYALSLRNSSVLLNRRPQNASLMPGMWELPEVVLPRDRPSAFQVRHSITVTDYLVHVFRIKTPRANGGHWIGQSRVSGLPLTGLTRKILRAAGVI